MRIRVGSLPYQFLRHEEDRAAAQHLTGWPAGAATRAEHGQGMCARAPLGGVRVRFLSLPPLPIDLPWAVRASRHTLAALLASERERGAAAATQGQHPGR